MITFSTKGDFSKTEQFLIKAKRVDIKSILDTYGRQGVASLSASTPVESGRTASSWDYTVKGSRGSYEIVWTNSNVHNGVNIAVILQYGHGTGTGGYVRGRDYINPAMRPVFDQIAKAAWKAVITA